MTSSAFLFLRRLVSTPFTDGVPRDTATLRFDGDSTYTGAMTSFRSKGRVQATWLILIAAVAAGLGLWLGLRQLQAPALPPLEAAVAYPAPRALPEFSLSRSDGTSLTLADWKGHWTVVFFGFTNCPDVCPTTLTTFKQVHKRLADAGVADRVRFTFISVDPARDTPDALARYVGYFSKDFVAATGPDEALQPLTRALGLIYTRGEPKDGTYSVDHSASVVLIDPAGRQVGLFRPPFDPAKMAADLQKLAAN